jgi:hypothetical protein
VDVVTPSFAQCSGSSLDFSGIRLYGMFLCHARSGHSLLGSLLDAHPEIVIAHEFHALRFVQRGGRRDQLFQGLLRSSENFSRRGRKWNGYNYKVPNQWQGRYQKLSVIGDKMGFSSTGILKRDPLLLRQLQATVQIPIKFFRMIRNPFDNIKTLSRYYYRNKLTSAIEGYFSACVTIETIKSEINPYNLTPSSKPNQPQKSNFLSVINPLLQTQSTPKKQFPLSKRMGS